jgi:hypothetical protein
LSFDLLCQLSGLGLLRGLPLLKFGSNLVCAPCRHGKMIVASHSPVNTMMDTVGPSQVCSKSSKWYVLVIVADVTLGFSSWKARMKCLNTFGAWLLG